MTDIDDPEETGYPAEVADLGSCHHCRDTEGPYLGVTCLPDGSLVELEPTPDGRRVCGTAGRCPCPCHDDKETP